MPTDQFSMLQNLEISPIDTMQTLAYNKLPAEMFGKVCSVDKEFALYN